MTEYQLNKISYYFKAIMEVMEIDLTDPNFIDTPQRVAKTYNELFKGLSPDADKEMEQILSTTFPCNYNEMIVSKNLQSWTMCPHHFLPVKLKVNIAYIPDTKVLGLSKMPRIVNILAARPCLQERLTLDIVNKISEILQPKGVIVRIAGEHLCMQIRGVRSMDSEVITTAFLGYFENSVSRAEFFEAIKS